jgi:hypothetical protein
MPDAESHPRRRRRPQIRRQHQPGHLERLIRTNSPLEAERHLVPEFSPVRLPGMSSSHSRNSNRNNSRINNSGNNLRRNSNNSICLRRLLQFCCYAI